MVSLNLRLLPKLMKRGILGGSSSNTYLSGERRKIDMQLIFPKEHWKLTEQEGFYTFDLLNYSFVGSTLEALVPTLKERIAAQEINYEKAKARLKEAKKVLKDASPRYKSSATLALDQAIVNEGRQKDYLKKMKAILRTRKKTPQEIIKENGKM